MLNPGRHKGARRMQHWVALLRGVNVGGHNLLPMADLRELCSGLGWTGVQTYIASGNVLFVAEGAAEDLAATLQQMIAARMACEVPVIVLPATALRAAVADCPFEPQAGKHVHGFICWSDPVVDPDALGRLRAASEILIVTGRWVWLYAPDGIGPSKLAAKLDKVITGTQMTGRNLNTLRKLVEMLDDGRPG